MLYCKQTYTMRGFFANYSQELATTGSTLWFRQQRGGGRQHSRPPGEPSSKGASSMELGDDGNFPILSGGSTRISQKVIFTNIHHFRA